MGIITVGRSKSDYVDKWKFIFPYQSLYQSIDFQLIVKRCAESLISSHRLASKDVSINQFGNIVLYKITPATVSTCKSLDCLITQLSQGMGTRRSLIYMARGRSRLINQGALSGWLFPVIIAALTASVRFSMSSFHAND